MIIYVAGAVGNTLLHSMKKNHILLDFFIDRRHDEVKNLDAVPVNSAERLSEMSGDESVVIVSVTAKVIRGFNKPVFENIERKFRYLFNNRWCRYHYDFRVVEY